MTIVQLRDKTSDTASLVETAKKLHQVTKEYNVPLLINDRVDVALAAGVEGVHIGQDDMGQSSFSSTDTFADASSCQTSPPLASCWVKMQSSE